MIKLGSRVRERITGLEGVVTARLEYINGCVQYCLQPSDLQDGRYVKGIYLDEQLLEIIGPGLNREEIDPRTLPTRGGPSAKLKGSYPN